MRYFVGIGNDRHTFLWQQILSYEMIGSLESVGNQYAKRTLKYLEDNTIEKRIEE